MAPHVCDMLADLEVATRSGFAGKQSAQVQALRHCLNLFSGGQQQDEAKEALSALLHALLGEVCALPPAPASTKKMKARPGH